MGQGQRSNQIMNPAAYKALEQFKYEVANELGIQAPEGDYWGDVSSRQCGAIGGHMVRRMIAAAEQSLMDQTTATVRAGFQQGFQDTNDNRGTAQKQP